MLLSIQKGFTITCAADVQDLTEKVMADEEVKAITTGGPLPGAMQDASAHMRR